MNITVLKTKLSLLLLCCVLFFACQSREDKIRDVAYKLTSSSAFLNNPNIRKLTAGIVGDSQLNIRITLNIENDPMASDIYQAILPQMGKMLLEDKDIKSIINDGGNVRVILQDRLETEMASKVFNTRSLASIDKLDVSNDFDDREHGQSKELNSMLTIMNDALPIVDEESGTEIYKISISKQKELVYWVKVDKDLALLLKMESVGKIMKEELCSDVNIKNVFSTVRRLGLSKIVYKYVNENKEELTSISINSSDLRN